MVAARRRGPARQVSGFAGRPRAAPPTIGSGTRVPRAGVGPWGFIVGGDGRRAGRARRGRRAGSAGAGAGVDGYVCFSAQDWWYHNRAHSDFQLMTRVARERPVLLVNSIAMRMPLPGRSTKPLRRIVRKARSMAKRLQTPVPELPDFHVLTPVLLPLYGSRLGRALNARLVGRQVRQACRRLGLRAPACVVTIPTAWDVVRHVPHAVLVYNRSDLHSAFTETDQEQIRALERQLLAGCDAVLYVSRSLLAAERDLVGDRAHFLDHGVDVAHFRRRGPEEEPADLAAVARPRIGFFGGLDSYLVDFGLLERLAREVPEAQLVLVGDADCSMARFDSLPNVHWLGHRPYEDIPRYGSGFDVALMPWLRNSWIEHANPIKLKEYLALGLPVMSTDFPEVRHYQDWVDVASDADEFVAYVRKALAAAGTDAVRGSEEARRAAVAGATWDARVEDLRRICER
jgi:glycosyltransferase involved in cell wall biosynthesis